jgi:hypothetical protein
VTTVSEGLAIARGLGLPIHEHYFGGASSANLEGVAPALVDVAMLALRLCPYDGTVLPGGGLRTVAQAQDNVRRGTGIADSRHLPQADGKGRAIDCVALSPGKGVDWKNAAAFHAMAEAVGKASAILNVPIRQGCDWNMNGVFGEGREWDWAHFEEPKLEYMPAAQALLDRRREELGLEDVGPGGASCRCPSCGALLSACISLEDQ